MTKAGLGAGEAVAKAALPRVVREADEGLCEVSEAFDFLLYVTPTNVDQQWRRYVQGGRRTAPSFEYRPLPFDPARLKRLLFNLPLEDVENEDLALLFEEKRDELDRQITLLEDRGTKRFKPGALQLYGPVPEDLVELADVILEQTERCPKRRGQCLRADVIAGRAKDEIEYYRSADPEFDALVEVSDDVVAGMMVSHNTVMISKTTSLPQRRIAALLQHEIGTHLVTFYNGRVQPLQIFQAGLAGYESLQEGLAVMAEWVTSGLEPRRLRSLAARVVAADSMCRDASFADTFGLLRDKWKFSSRAAFRATARVYRGGGFPKDAVYLEGFRSLHRLMAESFDWRHLFVGKIAFSHLPIVERLLQANLLYEPKFKPRYLSKPGAEREFERIAKLSLTQVFEEMC